MKSTSLTVALIGLLFTWSFTATAQEIEGGTSGTKYDIFVVNDDESHHDAGIRLQTRAGDNWKDWNIWNNRQDAKLHFSLWTGTSHSNSNENDIGSYKMTLQSNGYLGVGKTSPIYRIHAAGDIYADGGWMRVSGNKGIYFQSHGGGLYMTDATWIRTYGNKNFYHNTGIMRTDGAFQVGSSGTRFHVTTGGNVGVGVTNPSAKLDVNGAAYVRGNMSFAAGQGRGIRFWNEDRYGMTMGNAATYKYGPVQDYSIRMNMSNHANRGWVWGVHGETPIAALSNAGNMQIAGTLTANRVTVNVGSFPDYVFADDYTLMPLNEVANFIEENKHLPNMPSEKEVIETGMDITTINTKLVEKVEELTLYTIQQEEKIDALTQKLESLEKLLNSKKVKKKRRK